MIFDEEKYAKNVFLGKNKDIKSIVEKINLLVRYNQHVLCKNDSENYLSTVSWLKLHQNIFSESNYSNLINSLIKKAPKNPFYKIDNLIITNKEIEFIESQNNLRYEKILFVLLCMAKFQKQVLGFDNGLVHYNIIDVFKMARVSVKASEREDIFHDFYVNGIIDLPIKNNTKCLFVKFIDDNETDKKFLLNEIDSEELAYFYLNYVKKDKKIIRCKKCGKLIKKNEKFNNLCESCFENKDVMKKIWCMDCGIEIEINPKDNQTIRCATCTKKYRNNYQKELMRKQRQKS